MKKLLCTILAATMSAIGVFGIAACGQKSNELEVVAPDGAPALALLNAIAGEEQKEEELFDFEVVNSSLIQTFVTGASPKADIAVLPVNLAAKMLGNGASYEMLGAVTWGNFYFLTTGDNPVLTAENLGVLTGKKVGVVQLPNVPGLTFRSVLGAHELDCNVLPSAQAEAVPEKVNLVAFDSAENVTPASLCDYYLCPEPAASTKIAKTASSPTPFKKGGDLQALYGEGGYPQAVAVAKKSVIESRKKDVETFISYLEGSAEYLASVTPATVLALLDDVRTEGLKPSFSAENLTPEVIANCSVRYTASKLCKQDVVTFLTKLMGIDPQAAALPADGFFYMD